jgi:uncharacterized membrane protein required for colicin V production
VCQEETVNELDYILIFIILIGVASGLRRCFVRVLISIIGIYLTVIVAGYAYQPMGDTVTSAAARIGIELGSTEAHNFIFLAVVIAMTVTVEWVSRATFDETRIPSLRGLDNLLGGLVGVYYGALWASFFLVPAQYSVARTGGSWTTAVVQSNLVPTLNQVFQGAVLDIVSIFFIDGTPELYLNPISERVAVLFMNLAPVRQVFF